MGVKNVFIFDGKSSGDYGIYISGGQTFNAPERDVESIEIPGRNGNLTISRNRFKNIMVPYPVFVHKQFNENVAAARAWLLGSDGYCRLEDTYHPDQYRMAQFNGPIDFEMRFLNYSGETTLTFNCKPQRWLKTGEQVIQCSNGDSILNSGFPALPLIKVSGTGGGYLYVGACVVQILSLDEYVILDSETQNAYKGTINKNGTIAAPEFPVLQTGENTIYWGGGITAVEITPRWWTI